MAPRVFLGATQGFARAFPVRPDAKRPRARGVTLCQPRGLRTALLWENKADMTQPRLARARKLSAALAPLLLWSLAAPAAGDDVTLAAHRAIYEMSLAGARGGSG